MDNIWFIIGFSVVVGAIAVVALLSYIKIKGVDSYYIADRGAKWYLIVGSLMASTVSGASFFGMMGFYYDLGASVFWIPIGVAWSWFIICYFIGPRLRRFGQFTIPDYLAERFDSPRLRPVFSLLVAIWMVILLGTIYIQGGLLFTTMFGWDYVTSIIVIGIIVVIFTVLGGMVAVLNSDFISMFAIFVAMIVSVPIILNAAGGWGEVTSVVSMERPDFFKNTSSIGIAGAISWFLIWCVGYLGHPGYLTRFYTAVNEREIVKAGIGITFLYLPFWILIFVAAVSAKLLYPSIGDSELIWVTYMYDYAPAFIVGIGMAGIFAAVLSSANSWLMAAATSIGRDIYQKVINKDVSDQKLLNFSKLTVVILGALSVPIGIWRPTYIMEIMNIAYMIAGSSGGIVILMSMYYRKMNKLAAWVGIVGGASIAITWRGLQLVGTLGSTIDPILPTLVITFIAIIVTSQFSEPSEKSLEVFDRLNRRQA